MAPEAERLASEIRNDGYMVRHYARNRLLRAQAILKLGLTVRHAFSESSDFETLLAAVADAVRPRDDRPF